VAIGELIVMFTFGSALYRMIIKYRLQQIFSR